MGGGESKVNILRNQYNHDNPNDYSKNDFNNDIKSGGNINNKTYKYKKYKLRKK